MRIKYYFTKGKVWISLPSMFVYLLGSVPSMFVCMLGTSPKYVQLLPSMFVYLLGTGPKYRKPNLSVYLSVSCSSADLVREILK